uniref:Uncharacterized protein n=1 Tax=Rhizophora mucronata TaxID=61149 RepID=A0A2P2IJP8_RHIMU
MPLLLLYTSLGSMDLKFKFQFRILTFTHIFLIYYCITMYPKNRYYLFINQCLKHQCEGLYDNDIDILELHKY